MNLFDSADIAIDRLILEAEAGLVWQGYKKPLVSRDPVRSDPNHKATDDLLPENREIHADTIVNGAISFGRVPHAITRPGIRQDSKDVKSFSASSSDMQSPSVKKILGKYTQVRESVTKSISQEHNDNGVRIKAEPGVNSCDSMSNPDHRMANSTLEMTDGCYDPIPSIYLPSLDGSEYASLNAMQQKYVDGVEVRKLHHGETMETIVQELQSIEQQEENTLELRSQIIFNRSNTGHGTASYPHDDMKDPLGHAEYPSKGDNSILQSPDELEKAIKLALTQSKIRVSPNEVCPMRREMSHYSCSAKKHSSTPSMPESLPIFLPVDEAKYATLPSFIRGQLPLEVLNKAHNYLYDLISKRSSAGEQVGFNIADVESATDLPQGKSKVLLNALAKLEQVNLKVIYGRGAVYYFV